mmetsp:Transcript_14628/g.35484  ORF Transcript_14628/g.35484 Transcript_14628/m.35484 type:complete len:436 (-) Transcript_14628:166-1473(-)
MFSLYHYFPPRLLHESGRHPDCCCDSIENGTGARPRANLRAALSGLPSLRTPLHRSPRTATHGLLPVHRRLAHGLFPRHTRRCRRRFVTSGLHARWRPRGKCGRRVLARHGLAIRGPTRVVPASGVGATIVARTVAARVDVRETRISGALVDAQAPHDRCQFVVKARVEPRHLRLVAAGEAQHVRDRDDEYKDHVGDVPHVHAPPGATHVLLAVVAIAIQAHVIPPQAQPAGHSSIEVEGLLEVLGRRVQVPLLLVEQALGLRVHKGMELGTRHIQGHVHAHVAASRQLLAYNGWIGSHVARLVLGPGTVELGVHGDLIDDQDDGAEETERGHGVEEDEGGGRELLDGGGHVQRRRRFGNCVRRSPRGIDHAPAHQRTRAGEHAPPARAGHHAAAAAAAAAHAGEHAALALAFIEMAVGAFLLTASSSLGRGGHV